MKKLIAIALLTLLSTGCAYKGACQTDGISSQPYNDNKRYSSVACTEYCSVQIPGLCRNSPSEMMQAVQDKHFENDKMRCTKFGFETGTEAMSNCLMKENTNRESALAAQTAQANSQAAAQAAALRAENAEDARIEKQKRDQQYQQQQQFYQQRIDNNQKNMYNRPVQTTCNKNYYTGQVNCTSQ
jgi:PBP1b-binding outer membrane lipoprotein LpoB